jgi:hypothetical protein
MVEKRSALDEIDLAGIGFCVASIGRSSLVGLRNVDEAATSGVSSRGSSSLRSSFAPSASASRLLSRRGVSVDHCVQMPICVGRNA